MTRVVIIANNIEELGGAQRIGHVLAQGLAGRGYAVELLGLVPKSPAYHYASSVPTRTLLDEPLAPRREKRARVEQRARISAALQDVLDSGEPGIIITVQLRAMEHVRDINSDGWRLIGQYHSSYQAALASGDIHRIEAQYRTADWFTVLTEQDRLDFAQHDLNNLIVMANPIDPWPEGTADHSHRVITVLGRISEEKGPDIALDAWRAIATEFPDWSLQFVGDGPLVDLVRTSNAPRVRYVPTTTDALRTLRETGVFCLPSLTEGMPLALMEAMATGLPVVASDCSAGVHQLVGDAGILVPPGNPDALAASLRALLTKPALRESLGIAARERMATYRPEKILDRWHWLLTQTLR